MSYPCKLLQVRKATGANLAHSTQLLMSLVVGVVIGLIFAWQIGEFMFVLGLVLHPPRLKTTKNRNTRLDYKTLKVDNARF